MAIPAPLGSLYGYQAPRCPCLPVTDSLRGHRSHVLHLVNEYVARTIKQALTAPLDTLHQGYPDYLRHFSGKISIASSLSRPLRYAIYSIAAGVNAPILVC